MARLGLPEIKILFQPMLAAPRAQHLQQYFLVDLIAQQLCKFGHQLLMAPLGQPVETRLLQELI